ncbi:MAG: hypothetical protein RL885_04975 [Planctomycetota bacterium]
MERDIENRPDGDEIIEISDEMAVEEIVIPETDSGSGPAGEAGDVPPTPGMVPPGVMLSGWSRIWAGQVFPQYFRFFLAFLAILIGSAWSRMTVSDPQTLVIAVAAADAGDTGEAAEEGAEPATEVVVTAIPQVDMLHTSWGPFFLLIGAIGVFSMGLAIFSPRYMIRFGPIFLASIPFIWGFYYIGDVVTATQNLDSFGALFSKLAPGEGNDFDTIGQFFRNLGPGFIFVWGGALVVELSFIGSIFSSLAADKKKQKEAAAARAAARGDRGDKSEKSSGRRSR